MAVSFIPFSAIIEKTGIQRFVLLSQAFVKSLGVLDHRQVLVRVDDIQVRTSLVPAGKGYFKLFLNAAIRSASGAGDGTPIHLELCAHQGSAELPLPRVLQMALEEQPHAIADFFALSTGKRNEVIKFINAAKKPETQHKRALKCRAMLARMVNDHRSK